MGGEIPSDRALFFVDILIEAMGLTRALFDLAIRFILSG
jgi:hypothetical protein